ncbi:hypothetical protein JVU11DRAFT_9187 [Chiua virens]|nr:hypothetical protein JVU11DRAFT_9187 [Chiua virens]
MSIAACFPSYGKPQIAFPDSDFPQGPRSSLVKFRSLVPEASSSLNDDTFYSLFWNQVMIGSYEPIVVSTVPLPLGNAQESLLGHSASLPTPNSLLGPPLDFAPPDYSSSLPPSFPLEPSVDFAPPDYSSSSLPPSSLLEPLLDFTLRPGHPAPSYSSNQALVPQTYSLLLAPGANDAQSQPPFLLTPFSSDSFVVELQYPDTVQPNPQALQVPPPPLPLTAEMFPWNDYTDGGSVSNTSAFPIMVTHILHIDRPWAHVFLHTWHMVFHDTHTSHPPSRLTHFTNRALSSAYVRWEQLRPSEPLKMVPITINGIVMLAMQQPTNASEIINGLKEALNLFNTSFKDVIKLARQSCMNQLLRSTLGALVKCQVIDYLPPPHVDTRPLQSNITILPRVYSEERKNFYQSAAQWNHKFGCQIWHEFTGPECEIVWFGNYSVRRFVATLLSPDEREPHTLGVRHARRGPRNVLTSWGPVVDLDNNSVLTLLAKILASLSTSIVYDVAQRPRQLPFDKSEGRRNRAINDLTSLAFKLLKALDDLSLPYTHLLAHERANGHRELIRLKEELGFRV